MEEDGESLVPQTEKKEARKKFPLFHNVEEQDINYLKGYYSLLNLKSAVVMVSNLFAAIFFYLVIDQLYRVRRNVYSRSGRGSQGKMAFRKARLQYSSQSSKIFGDASSSNDCLEIYI